MTVVPVPILHGPRTITGYRVGRFAYLTDCSGIPDDVSPCSATSTCWCSAPCAIGRIRRTSRLTEAVAAAWRIGRGARSSPTCATTSGTRRPKRSCRRTSPRLRRTDRRRRVTRRRGPPAGGARRGQRNPCRRRSAVGGAGLTIISGVIRCPVLPRRPAARGVADAIVAVGNFDGMHRGHAKILERVCRQAAERPARRWC